MPYYKQTIDDKVVSKACAAGMPEGEGWSLIEGDPADVEVYQEPLPTLYNGDTMIAWGINTQLSQLPNTTAEEKAVAATAIAAFLDFANKATDSSSTNFMAIAVSIGMSEMAETIIAKAIELGANITVGDE